jgi:outer membrane protein assembly factor BamB
VTDGERVIASFASDGLYCFDLRGNELWKRTDLGRQIHIWGNGASPVLYGDLCFLNFGPGETTYLLAVNKHTGQTVWRRNERTGYGEPPTEDVQPGGGATDKTLGATYIGSWTTPTLMKVEGRDQLLMNWPRRLAAYDPQTGHELWSCSGLNPLVYTSPIFANDIIVVMGGYNGASMAVRAGGSGDITATRRMWHVPKTPQRIGSGVIHDGHSYVHNDPGVAECLELETGKLIWRERLSGPDSTVQNWSSVMLAGGNCYTINQGGDCFVFRASPKFTLVSVNSLGEKSNSSIVPADGRLFIRTHKSLWCIGE